MDKQNSRNTTVFMIVMFAVLIAYELLVIGPREKAREAQQRVAAAQAQQNAQNAPGAATYVSREQAAAASPRITINTPALQGSIALKGGRVDDLFLKDYRVTVDKNSPPVELFRPEGAKQAYFADFGWTGPVQAPGPMSQWSQTGGGQLSPGHPVTLSFDNGAGLAFTRTVSVDDHYMFTVTDTVANKGSAPVKVAPYATVQRQGLPELARTNIIHEGAIGELGGQLHMITFKNWKKQGDTQLTSTGGWLGITDKYWLAALAPQQSTPIKAQFRADVVNGVDVYEADEVGPVRTVGPGATASSTVHLFAGAKKVSVLANYEKTLGIPRFDDAVDWGHFWFFTRPIFWLLETIHSFVGNFGVSIILLTFVLRGAMFPLANKSSETMAKTKKLQPRIEQIKNSNTNAPQKAQQEISQLYQREGINPFLGCLPLLLQIPLFFSLYKVLYVTLEMRHAPFFGWIKDLSAPDPSSFVNLFGLLPFNPANVPVIGHFLDGPLHIGVYPILYGLTMWLSQNMSPQAAGVDPSQRAMLQFMPLIFLFFFSHTPAGLVIYWVMSNLFTIGQQYFMMHRYKVENPIDNFIARLKGGRAAVPAKG